MRVIIISDMEGVAGIVRWQQVDASDGAELYQEGRRLYTAEINAAVRGARSGGADSVIVMDCHGAGGDHDFNSLIAEDLDPDCEWVVQTHWTSYTAALEEGCDAAVLIGMHARAGTPLGVLNHTVSTQSWYELRFNNKPVGEIGINAALCGHWRCPVLLVSGDSATCDEGRDLLGAELITVPVKEGLGRYGARMIHPAKARTMIETAVARAVAQPPAVKPYRPDAPCEIAVDFLTSGDVDPYARRPGVEVTGARTIVSRADDWWAAWTQFFQDG